MFFCILFGRCDRSSLQAPPTETGVPDERATDGGAFVALDSTWFHAALLMAAPCVKPPPLYKPRDPRASDLWQLIDEHFETFRQVYLCSLSSWNLE